jgi:hypothetical protein
VAAAAYGGCVKGCCVKVCCYETLAGGGQAVAHHATPQDDLPIKLSSWVPFGLT